MLTRQGQIAFALQIAESESDEMKNRLRTLHEAAEQKDATLKKYEACLAQQ